MKIGVAETVGPFRVTGHMVWPTYSFFFFASFPSIGMYYGRGWNGAVELSHKWAKGMESSAPFCLDRIMNDGKYELPAPLTAWNFGIQKNSRFCLDLAVCVDAGRIPGGF